MKKLLIFYRTFDALGMSAFMWAIEKRDCIWYLENNCDRLQQSLGNIEL